MAANYIIRLKDNRLFCFYYTRDIGILYKTYERNKWSKSRTIFQNAREAYSVNISYDGKIYLFCQDQTGNIVLCMWEGDENWNTRVILRNQSRVIHTILFNAIITEKGLTLIYNVPPSDDKAAYLLRQQLNQNGQWSAGERIDRFIDMGRRMYQVQNVSSDHLLLFYQTRTPENNLGYREVTPSQYGRFNIFHTTGYPVTDYAFLTTGQAIHVAYVVKSMFSSQLIYRKKENEAFNNAIVLYEGPRIDNILIYIAGNNIFVSYMNGDVLYTVTSGDRGNSFSRPSKYRNKFCLAPVKSIYLSETAQDEALYFVREVYVDSHNPCDIQIMPDLIDSFYPDYMPEPPVERQPETERPDVGETIQRLQNQLSTIQKQASDKDMQIINMTNLLKLRNDEIIQIDLDRKKVLQKLTEERDALSRELEEIKAMRVKDSYEDEIGI